MAIPGANPDEINVSVTGDTVTVSGEIKRERHAQKGQPYFQEIWQGQFQRSFQLPVQVDANKAEASFENGILTLTLPKSEETRPRKIQVKQQQTIQGQQSGQTGSERETVPVQGGSSS
jgi:HSP20 family protein